MERTHPLSQDCWTIILQDASFEDCLSVSKTCINGSISAMPFLYRRITWDWTTPPLRRVLQLLRTITSRPDLAVYVRELCIQSSEFPWVQKRYAAGPERRELGMDWRGPWQAPQHDVDWAQERSLFEDVVQKGTDIIHQAQFPGAEADEWIQALNNGDAYAYVAVLLSQLPDIESLRLDYSFVWMGGYPGRMIKHCLLARNGSCRVASNKFDALQSVDYGGNVPPPEQFATGDAMPDGFPPSYNCDQFIGWFHLPSIRNLSIWLRDTDDLRRVETKPKHLSSLALARSTISEEDALFLLSCMPKLRKLHLGLAFPWAGGLFKRPDLLIQALELFSDSMESLSLGLDYFPGGLRGLDHNDEYEQLFHPFVGVLKRFRNLQTAEVPVDMLLGSDQRVDETESLSDVLPSTLHKLVIRDDLAAVRNTGWERPLICHTLDLVFLLLFDFDTPPKLRLELTLRMWDGHYIQNKELYEQGIYLACHHLGLPFNVITDNHSYPLWAQGMTALPKMDISCVLHNLEEFIARQQATGISL